MTASNIENIPLLLCKKYNNYIVVTKFTDNYGSTRSVSYFTGPNDSQMPPLTSGFMPSRNMGAHLPAMVMAVTTVAVVMAVMVVPAEAAVVVEGALF